MGKREERTEERNYYEQHRQGQRRLRSCSACGELSTFLCIVGDTGIQLIKDANSQTLTDAFSALSFPLMNRQSGGSNKGPTDD